MCHTKYLSIEERKKNKKFLILINWIKLILFVVLIN